MIDWARIEELRTELGEEDFTEIASLFLAEIEETVAELPALATPTARSDALHGMKGSALNLGFRDFADLCARGELTPDAVEIPRLSRALDASVAAVRERFPDLA